VEPAKSNQAMKVRYYIASILFAVFIVYPLSIGPLLLCLKPYPRIPDWVVTFYKPLAWVAERSPAAHQAYIWYMELWFPEEVRAANGK